MGPRIRAKSCPEAQKTQETHALNGGADVPACIRREHSQKEAETQGEADTQAKTKAKTEAKATTKAKVKTKENIAEEED